MNRINWIVFLVFILISSSCHVLAYDPPQELSIVDEINQLGLPVLVIATENGEMPDCEYYTGPEASPGAHSIRNATKVPGRVYIMEGDAVVYDSGAYIPDEQGMTIKIRGNVSAYKPKKSYKIKLQKKADMLCRGDKRYYDKNWVLLKDEQIKTKIGLKVNELMGIQWTPSYKYVNVVFNDEYWGVYMLVEQVRRNQDCRLNVSKSGYVFEYDGYWWNENLYVISSLAYFNHYTFVYPESDEITPEELDYFTNMINDFESSIPEGRYSDLIDVNSFVRWLICTDIFWNPDYIGSGYFLTKYDNTPSSKIMMANLWDFDEIFHEVTRNRWSQAHNYAFFKALFESPDPQFVTLYQKIWIEEGGKVIAQMISLLEDYSSSKEASALDKSIALDNERWGEEHPCVKECVDHAIACFTERLDWMNREVPALTTGVEGIRDAKSNEDSNYPVYDFTGRVMNTQRKGLVLEYNKGKYVKVLK